ncbi:MAG: carboxylating nicotinate-nucleotide diphosphorylase [Acidobacteriia bacterium]|nr:carboxylating nicotinate-nucleotide diphosphorylase [Terriglobia bacterium]
MAQSSSTAGKTAAKSFDWDSDAIGSLVRQALAEDIGTGDATTLATVPEKALGQARVLAREGLVCADLPLAEKIFRALDAQMRLEFFLADGQRAAAGQELFRLEGHARAILTGERTALNFLAHLSGIATLTAEFVSKLAGTKARIRDTRKTTPLLRALEKYAVRMGGGVNHRIGLYDAILLKENHIALAGGVHRAVEKARAGSPSLPLQVEVRNAAELGEALAAGADSILLDNMPVEAAGLCVSLARELRPQCIVEISGGINLTNARAYALTGADFLSSGMLTHSAPAANLSLLVENVSAG